MLFPFIMSLVHHWSSSEAPSPAFVFHIHFIFCANPLPTTGAIMPIANTSITLFFCVGKVSSLKKRACALCSNEVGKFWVELSSLSNFSMFILNFQELFKTMLSKFIPLSTFFFFLFPVGLAFLGLSPWKVLSLLISITSVVPSERRSTAPDLRDKHPAAFLPLHGSQIPPCRPHQC